MDELVVEHSMKFGLSMESCANCIVGGSHIAVEVILDTLTCWW